MPKAPKLRQLRERKLLSQEDLAALAGVSRATISHIETGEDARISTLRRIAAALEVNAAEVLAD